MRFHHHLRSIISSKDFENLETFLYVAPPKKKKNNYEHRSIRRHCVKNQHPCVKDIATCNTIQDKRNHCPFTQFIAASTNAIYQQLPETLLWAHQSSTDQKWKGMLPSEESNGCHILWAKEYKGPSRLSEARSSKSNICDGMERRNSTNSASTAYER